MPPKKSRKTTPRPNPSAPAHDPSHLSMDQILALPVTTIRAHLRQQSLSTAGLKKVLAARLFDHFNPLGNTTPSPTTNGNSTAIPPVPAGATPPSPAAPQSQEDLQQMVSRLVSEGVQSAIQQLQPTGSSITNLSLPSRDGAAHDVPLTSTPIRPTLPAPPTNPSVVAQDLPPVPLAIKSKIEKGEYIDFNSLLQENMFPLPSTDTSYTLKLRPDPDSQSDVLVTQPKQKRLSISDLPTWLQAWNTYVMLYVNKEPHKALELLAYQRCICEAASRSPNSSWLMYDKKFRMAVASDSTLPWGKRHPELWLECFTSQQPKPQSSSATQPSRNQPRMPCTYCSSTSHFPDNCPRNPFHFHGSNPPSTPIRARPGDFRTKATRPYSFQPICRDFNGPGCKRQPCNFRHQCSDCGGFHSKRDCPPRTSRP